MSDDSIKSYYRPRKEPLYPFSDRPLITWDIRYAFLTSVEFPVDALRAIVPPELDVFEARPGVGLAVMTMFHYAPWQQKKYEDLYETIFMVQVVPDLRWGIPNLAVFVASFGSNDGAFLADERANNLFPTFDALFQVEVDTDAHRVRCRDGARDVYDLAFSGRRAPVYSPQDVYCQVYVRDGGHLHVSHNTFSGLIYQHQEDGDGGVLHDHPFFRGADVTGRRLTPYLQMISEPGGALRQAYYWRPERVDRPGDYDPPLDPTKLTDEEADLLRRFRHVDNIPRGVRMPVRR